MKTKILSLALMSLFCIAGTASSQESGKNFRKLELMQRAADVEIESHSSTMKNLAPKSEEKSPYLGALFFRNTPRQR